MRLRLIKKVLYAHLTVFLCIAISYTTARGNDTYKYKYYELKQTPLIKEIIYSDKKAINSLMIKLKNYQELISIECVPLTEDKFKKYRYRFIEDDKRKSSTDEIILKINDKKVKAQRIINDSNCSIILNDYYRGIAFFIRYFGGCNKQEYFEKIVSGITYRISDDAASKARDNFLKTTSSIKTFDIPIHKDAFKIERDDSPINFYKRINYEVEIDGYSTEIFKMYKRHFLKLGWKPYEDENKGYWKNNQLLYTWTDHHDELYARLFIVPLPEKKNTKKVRQKIYFELYPYTIGLW